MGIERIGIVLRRRVGRLGGGILILVEVERDVLLQGSCGRADPLGAPFFIFHERAHRPSSPRMKASRSATL
jgi:hypothetical protein